MAQKWKVVARDSKAVSGATITQSVDTESEGWRWRYTATIQGWRNFRIAQGCPGHGDFTYEQVCNRVREIRDRIEADDEAVFHETHKIFWKDE